MLRLNVTLSVVHGHEGVVYGGYIAAVRLMTTLHLDAAQLIVVVVLQVAEVDDSALVGRHLLRRWRLALANGNSLLVDNADVVFNLFKHVPQLSVIVQWFTLLGACTRLNGHGLADGSASECCRLLGSLRVRKVQTAQCCLVAATSHFDAYDLTT